MKLLCTTSSAAPILFAVEGRTPRADVPTRMLITLAPNVALSWIVIVPADGTSLPREGNGDFGTSPFYGQQLHKRY